MRHLKEFGPFADIIAEYRAVRCYRIVRFTEGKGWRTVRNNVTLAEAQAHCGQEGTHGMRKGKRWFDGYDYMKGCKP